MGLLVVARLAQRHGITVRLSSVAGGGTAATVTVPDELLAPAPLADPLLRGRWRGTVVGPPGRHSEAVAPGRAGPISAAPISAAPVSAAPASAAPRERGTRQRCSGQRRSGRARRRTLLPRATAPPRRCPMPPSS